MSATLAMAATYVGVAALPSAIPDNIGEVADLIQNFVHNLAGSPLVYLAMFLLAALDQFFPPVPSDTVLISLNVAAHQLGQPNPWFLIPAAVIGAFIGNNICYLIGRKIGTQRFRAFRTPRGRAAIQRAERSIVRRGMGYIIAARYIPIARIAIIMTVGAVKYPIKKFWLASAISTISWGFNATAIGTIFGNIDGLHPVAAMVIGIIVGLIVGAIADRLVTWYYLRKETRREPIV
jgi:membrane protein DedA with SNARE-associated domain